MTSRIIISDRKQRLMKISLEYLLQNEAGLSLSDAARAVARIEREIPVEFDIADDKASSFIENADDFGAIASIVSKTDNPAEPPEENTDILQDD